MQRFVRSARCACAALAVAALGVPLAHAEKADRDKPINWSADTTAVNMQTSSGTLKGNVIITQGTITIHADRVDLKQNPDSSLSATAYGNPVSFREKKDGADEYYEGYAQKAVYDGTKQVLELFDRALLKQGINEMRSNYIWYNNATSEMKAEAAPAQSGATKGEASRVQGMFQPHGELAPGAKDAAGGPKGATAPAAKSGDKADGKAAPPKAAASPLTLKPDADVPAPNTAK